ncbi:MAG TPA: protein kinase [Candidatus Polarisedimenticolia bacterium]|nr:protein kinase [Candidatus Polarisedimenticolia bacterium]
MRCERCGAPLPASGWTTIPGAKPDLRAASLEFAPGSDFAERFTIIERTGEGGMGVVYKAIDRRLDHTVALKLIQPTIASHPEAIRRFKSEVLLARQISHPNVCRVHDLGESTGILYLSMAWVEGETLHRFLAQSGTMTPAAALGIVERVARALEAAHARRVVHRDLKPDNIMIDAGGEICVMDFGLATVTGDAAKSGGRIVGTPPYMSPEQRRGEEADPRSDLYALGIILWELLAGRLPSSPLDPASVKSDVPRPLASILASLLAEDRGARCASATVLLAAIAEARERFPELGKRSPIPRRRRWRAVAAAAVLAGAALVYVAVRPHLDARPPRAPTITTVPPETAGFFERGLYYLRDEGETARGLGDAIQMLHRAVGKTPEDGRAWAVLGEAYWVRFRQTGAPEAKAEAERALARATTLAPHLPETLHARGLGTLVAGDAGAARADFEKATQLAPDFDSAWESLGNADRDLGNYAEGLRELQTAVRLRPTSYLHQIALGRFFQRFAEYDAAAAAYRKAIDLKPDQPWGWNNLGAMYLFRARRPEEAVPAFKRSIALEDRGIARTNLGTAYFYMGNYEEALAQYRRATELESEDADNWGNVGDALYMLRRPEEARRAYQRGVALAQAGVTARPLDAGSRNQLAKYCAKAGRADCALEEARRAAEMQPDNPDMDFTNALAYAASGKLTEALDWLEKGVKHGLGRAQIEYEPFFAPLHASARYRAILAQAV